MEASDLIFGGIYDAVVPNKYIEYTLGDDRKVKITFAGNNRQTKITENFEAESANPVEMQRGRLAGNIG